MSGASLDITDAHSQNTKKEKGKENKVPAKVTRDLQQQEPVVTTPKLRKWFFITTPPTRKQCTHTIVARSNQHG
jgi:hypothetical protein